VLREAVKRNKKPKPRATRKTTIYLLHKKLSSPLFILIRAKLQQQRKKSKLQSKTQILKEDKKINMKTNKQTIRFQEIEVSLCGVILV
jgi:hypothetical protein